MATTPVAHALIFKNHTKALEILLKYRPHFILSTDTSGHTPLATATFAGNVRAVQLLLERGVDPNARAYDGSTPIMSAFGYDENLDDFKEQDWQSRRKTALQISRVLVDHG